MAASAFHLLHVTGVDSCQGYDAFSPGLLRKVGAFRNRREFRERAYQAVLVGQEISPKADHLVCDLDWANPDCQKWIADNYTTANPVTAMTERSQLKPRTFARRFKAATGYLPMDYVHALRIEEAKQLLENTGGGAEDVGFRVGYEDPTFFRRLFRRKVGLTPAVFRRKFTKILAAK